MNAFAKAEPNSRGRSRGLSRDDAIVLYVTGGKQERRRERVSRASEFIMRPCHIFRVCRVVAGGRSAREMGCVAKIRERLSRTTSFGSARTHCRGAAQPPRKED